MKYCSVCLNVNTRPGIKFNKKGICPACQYFFTIKNINWDQRMQILKNLLQSTTEKIKKKNNFDCIIGVSGGKDSTRQALWIRDKLKLNPLCVCLGYPPEQISEIGVDNISNLINLGFNIHIIYLSPKTWKKMMKLSFFKFKNMYKHSEHALHSAVPQIAIKYKIPIIFWGENPALQLGDLKTLGKTGYDGNKIKYNNTLSGGNINWLRKSGFKENKIFPYEYPSSKEFKKNNIQIIYMGWFWKDWSIVDNGLCAVTNGLKTRTDNLKNTSDLYGIFSLDEDWITFNQMIKYYKYGFGRVSDYLNEEIRIGRISRNEAISIASKYDSTYGDKYIRSFCRYIGISKKVFWKKVYSSVNKKLFVIKNKKIIPKFRVGKGMC